MHMDAILRITAILQANADGNLATDKFRLVDELQIEFPEIARDTLVALVEQSIATIGGRAI
jgi:hypothetical protein